MLNFKIFPFLASGVKRLSANTDLDDQRIAKRKRSEQVSKPEVAASDLQLNDSEQAKPPASRSNSEESITQEEKIPEMAPPKAGSLQESTVSEVSTQHEMTFLSPETQLITLPEMIAPNIEVTADSVSELPTDDPIFIEEARQDMVAEVNQVPEDSRTEVTADSNSEMQTLTLPDVPPREDPFEQPSINEEVPIEKTPLTGMTSSCASEEMSAVGDLPVADAASSGASRLENASEEKAENQHSVEEIKSKLKLLKRSVSFRFYTLSLGN